VGNTVSRGDVGFPPAAREEIRLLVRADDFGSTHASNLACIDAYRNGIVRSVEIMVPCPWFEEACHLVSENPELDVGVHLTITSEWTAYRWRPLTRCPSITDGAGYFLPCVWEAPGRAAADALVNAAWRLEEVEAEFRAQIDLCLTRIPHLSHLTAHMGWENAHLDFASVLWKLAEEYGYPVSTCAEPVHLVPGYDNTGSHDAQVDSFVAQLEALTPGTWMFIEHPAYDHPEMEGLHRSGYRDVGGHRGGVTRVLTSPRVRSTVVARRIRLISYRDLRLRRVAEPLPGDG
jgi:chitin disaccharide deacetylase